MALNITKTVIPDEHDKHSSALLQSVFDPLDSFDITKTSEHDENGNVVLQTFFDPLDGLVVIPGTYWAFNCFEDCEDGVIEQKTVMVPLQVEKSPIDQPEDIEDGSLDSRHTKKPKTSE